MRITNRRGFTLIEGLIASVVLAMCVAGMSSALIATTHQTIHADHSHAVFNAARSAMEQLAAQPLDSLSPANGTTSVEVLDMEQPEDESIALTGELSYITRSAAQPSRDIAVVAVTAMDESGASVTIRRVFTRAGGSR